MERVEVKGPDQLPRGSPRLLGIVVAARASQPYFGWHNWHVVSRLTLNTKLTAPERRV